MPIGPQCLGIALSEPHRLLPDRLRDVAARGDQIDPDVLESHCAGSIALAKQSEEQVFGADVAVPQVPGFVLRKHDDLSSRVGEALEHRYRPRLVNRRPACFWCTACLLTRSSEAISCHDHPTLRALST